MLQQPQIKLTRRFKPIAKVMEPEQREKYSKPKDKEEEENDAGYITDEDMADTDLIDNHPGPQEKQDPMKKEDDTDDDDGDDD
jgi:hypothetical protein